MVDLARREVDRRLEHAPHVERRRVVCSSGRENVLRSRTIVRTRSAPSRACSHQVDRSAVRAGPDAGRRRPRSARASAAPPRCAPARTRACVCALLKSCRSSSIRAARREAAPRAGRSESRARATSSSSIASTRRAESAAAASLPSRPGREPLGDQREVRHDVRERRVDLVRDARRERARATPCARPGAARCSACRCVGDVRARRAPTSVDQARPRVRARRRRPSASRITVEIMPPTLTSARYCSSTSNPAPTAAGEPDVPVLQRQRGEDDEQHVDADREARDAARARARRERRPLEEEHHRHVDERDGQRRVGRHRAQPPAQPEDGGRDDPVDGEELEIARPRRELAGGRRGRGTARRTRRRPRTAPG